MLFLTEYSDSEPTSIFGVLPLPPTASFRSLEQSLHQTSGWRTLITMSHIQVIKKGINFWAYASVTDP
jgi:hypothetical protein